MEYKKLQELRNLYPSDEQNIADSFTSDGTNIRYTGKYPEGYNKIDKDHFIDFQIIDFNSISNAPLHYDDSLSIRFIVEFVDGDNTQRWTSKALKDDLEAALSEPNPYFNVDKYGKLPVTIASVNFEKLKKYWRSKKFDIPERYAEVRITDTITTIEDMLKHIDWIVSTKDVDDELREVETFGAWSLYTGQDGLGFQYSQAIDDLDNGKIEGDDIITKDPLEQYKPFTEADSVNAQVGDVKVYEGNTYVWSGVGWVLK